MFKCFKNDLSPYIRDYDKDPLSSIPDVMPRKYIKKGLSITSAISEEMKDTDPNKYSRFIRR